MTAPILYDAHMHTPLCGHAIGQPEAYARQALRVGLGGVVFTCHAPMPDGFWPGVRMREDELDTYVAIVARAADRFRGRLDVRLGLESEYFPGFERYLARLHRRARFEYILGSVHWQSPEYRARFGAGPLESFRRRYFTHLADAAETGLYDCLSHPDLIKNHRPASWRFSRLADHVGRCLDRIAATGVAMELNTSGLRKPCAEMNPGHEMLALMAARGIPVVVGSDAHRPERVGAHFVEALEALERAGYAEVHVFARRRRRALRIADARACLRAVPGAVGPARRSRRPA
ncbi:MAG: histidinol-phosphatase [Acidobacteria bacterium]|nr:histidinol-phosphatase [Acidobacteriota bacterium]